MSSPRLPSVQRLIGLARSNGVDVRPTLLRVIVDQFVSEAQHPAAEVTRFAELVVNLLPRASEADRAIVAEKLADHPQTPTVVARALAHDAGAIARPILARCRALSDDDLFLAVRSGDADKALAVANREDIGLAALVALEDMDDPAIRTALATRVGRSLPAPAPRRPKPADLGQRFLAAATAQRETMLAELALAGETLPPGLGPKSAGLDLETAALSRREGALAEALTRTFLFDARTAAAIAGDAGGEPLVVCARALDLGREATMRMLLFAHEAIGTSVDRIYGLASLYQAIPRAAAVALVRSWQAAAVAETAARSGRHQPVMASDASDRVGARQAASVAARSMPRTPVARPGSVRLPKA